jgi:hypothetical protein
VVVSVVTTMGSSAILATVSKSQRGELVLLQR